MNRRERRARQRHIARDMNQRFGCRCTPKIASAGPEYAELQIPGATLYSTDHRSGCPLGDLAASMSAHGLIPIGHGQPLPRCDR